MELAAAGPETVAACGTIRPSAEFRPVSPARALAGEPVLRREGRDSGMGRRKLPGVEARRHFAPFDVFLPLFDYILANRSAALFGQDPYPPPPLQAPAA